MRTRLESGELVTTGDTAFPPHKPPAADAPLVLARFVGASPHSTNLARLLGNVCEELRRRFDLQEEVQEPARGGGTETVKRMQQMQVPPDPNEVIRKWPQFLTAASARGRVVIVLDAINQLDRTTDASRPYWVPRELPPGIKLILSALDHGPRSLPDASFNRDPTGSAPPEPPDWLSVLRRLKLREEPVPALTPAEQEKIIRDLPSVFCKTLEHKFVTQLLANRATTNPLFLIVALEELRTFGSFERLPDRISRLPQWMETSGDADPMDAALDAIFGQVLDRLERETQKQTLGLVPCIFRWLASAKQGLSEAELEGLLARRLANLPADLRNGELQVVLRQVRPYLMRKGYSQGALVDFYHRSFWKAVRAKYLPSAQSRHDSHGDLAEYFETEDWWLESLDEQRARAKRLPPTPRPANLRKVVELPAQRLAIASEAKSHERFADDLGAAYDRIAILFTDLDFLEAKTEGGLVYELAGDFAAAVAAMPPEHPQRHTLALVEEAIRREIRFLARHPTTLFQCLWNSCWWYDCPEAGSHYVTRESSPLSPPGPPGRAAGVRGDATGLLSPGAPGVTGDGVVMRGEPANVPPWDQPGEKLYELFETWRQVKAAAKPGFLWLRSLRPPPTHLGTGLRALLRGHEHSVCSVAYSPDTRRIVSGSDDRTVRVWDAESGEELRSMRGHELWVRSVAYSPDGRRIVSGAEDGTIRFWDPESGHNLHCLRDHEGWVMSVSYSPDFRRIVSNSRDGTVRVWDAESGQELRCLRGHEGEVWSVAYSPDGRRIVSGSDDWTVRVWDADSGQELRCLRDHEARVCRVAYSPDGRRIVSGAQGEKDRVWDAETGECLEVIQGSGDVAAIAAHASQRLVPGLQPGPDRAWRAISRGPETVVQAAQTQEDVAWFPAALVGLTTHLSGRSWAGGSANHVYIIKLEGGTV